MFLCRQLFGEVSVYCGAYMKPTLFRQEVSPYKMFGSISTTSEKGLWNNTMQKGLRNPFDHVLFCNHGTHQGFEQNISQSPLLDSYASESSFAFLLFSHALSSLNLFLLCLPPSLSPILRRPFFLLSLQSSVTLFLPAPHTGLSLPPFRHHPLTY
jgi:hypothetical protein